MGNIDKGNSLHFADSNGEFNECFIHDIEKLTHSNEYGMVFQRLNRNTVQLLKVKLNYLNVHNFKQGISQSPVKLIPFFPKDWITGLPEYFRCFWCTIPMQPEYLEKKDWVEVYYQWHVEDKPNVLIWWDHDLGDVVIDTISIDENGDSDADGVPTSLEDYDEITPEVYFYWIT